MVEPIQAFLLSLLWTCVCVLDLSVELIINIGGASGRCRLLHFVTQVSSSVYVRCIDSKDQSKVITRRCAVISIDSQMELLGLRRPSAVNRKIRKDSLERFLPSRLPVASFPSSAQQCADRFRWEGTRERKHPLDGRMINWCVYISDDDRSLFIPVI